MQVRNIIGVILIVLGLYLGYVGVNKISNNTNEIEFLGLEIDASNDEGQSQGVIYIVVAALMIGGGAVFMKGKRTSP